METTGTPRLRRPGKEARERVVAGVLLGLTSPLIGACVAAIKLEGLIDPDARGPAFFREDRVSQGRIIRLLKFRTLTASALASLPEGEPTHIAKLEKAGHLTRAGRLIRQWYLDELPQLWNIVKGDIGLVGTRPWPIELYEAEMAKGITRKRDMPAGLVGPVQAAKGDESAPSSIQLDLEYWEACRELSGWELFKLDARIVWRSFKTQLRHEGI